MRIRPVLAYVALVVLVATVAAAKMRIAADAAEAHRYADGVLLHQFTAALNEWTYQHPTDKPGEWTHVQKMDVGDRERWKIAVARFHELEDAMKKAGY